MRTNYSFLMQRWYKSMAFGNKGQNRVKLLIYMGLNDCIENQLKNKCEIVWILERKGVYLWSK